MENPNSVIVKVLRGREYGEIMKNGWKLHKLVKDINLKFKKLTSPKQVIPMKSMPGYIIIKLLKNTKKQLARRFKKQ